MVGPKRVDMVYPAQLGVAPHPAVMIGPHMTWYHNEVERKNVLDVEVAEGRGRVGRAMFRKDVRTEESDLRIGLPEALAEKRGFMLEENGVEVNHLVGDIARCRLHPGQAELTEFLYRERDALTDGERQISGSFQSRTESGVYSVGPSL